MINITYFISSENVIIIYCTVPESPESLSATDDEYNTSLLTWSPPQNIFGILSGYIIQYQKVSPEEGGMVSHSKFVVVVFWPYFTFSTQSHNDHVGSLSVLEDTHAAIHGK